MRICCLVILLNCWSLLWGQTFVTQTIIEDTLYWPAFQGPYILGEMLEIAPGGLLQIAPGTEIRFDFQAGIEVHGRLESLGTLPLPIIMGPLYPRSGQRWEGIRVQGEDASLRLNYTNILLAQTALQILPMGTDSLCIEDCVFAYGGRGISFSTEPVALRAEHNLITNNDFGLLFSHGGIFRAFRNNEICSNKQYEVSLFTSDLVDLSENCWCGLEDDPSRRLERIYDKRIQPLLGTVRLDPLVSDAGQCSTNNLNADFIKGGGDVTVVLDDYISVGVEELKLAQIKLYPNPLSTQSFLEFGDDWQAMVEINAFDVQGRLIWRRFLDPHIALKLRRSEFPIAGLYRLQIREQNGQSLFLPLWVE